MKVLFFSPHTLLDSSNGAALCVGTLLSELVNLGHACAAVTGAVIDAPNQLFDQVQASPPVSAYTVQNSGEALPVRHLTANGVKHFILGAPTLPHALSATTEVAHRAFFLDAFAQIEPDVVLTYGGFLSSYYAGMHALQNGRTSVLYAASANYGRDEAHQFDHVNTIHTVSDALRAKLDTVTALPKIVTQTFVRRADVVAATRTPDYITFINPVPSKGLKIAAAIMAECARRGRPYKFLLVDGRGNRDRVFQVCPELKGLHNLHFGSNTSDPRKIYERTALCLYPSLDFEAAGRVPIEANANGIPVLACHSGGVAQMLDGAGFLFDPPAALRENHLADIPGDYIAAWIDTIDRLHADPAFMADAVARARAADARYDTARMAQTFIEALKQF
jgi:glycosyltransferase involved in cell wall biosynthesis